MIKKIKACIHYLPWSIEALHFEHGPQQYGIRLGNKPKLKVTICMGKKKITNDKIIISFFVITGTVQHSLLMHISEEQGGADIHRVFVLTLDSGLCTRHEPTIPQVL